MTTLVSTIALAIVLVGFSTTPTRGVASWYCCTVGYEGKAVVALPGARYVPAGEAPWARVEVCVRQDDVERCGVFPVVDSCGCPDGRIVDLSIEAASRSRRDGGLGLDLSRGIWPATVRLVETPTIPATDTVPTPLGRTRHWAS